MRQSTAGFVLVMSFSVFAGSACYAQAKKPCDFITVKSDAESILGSPVNAGKDNQYNCQRSVEPGFTSKAPKNKQVSLSIWYSAAPDPNDYAVRRKNLVDYKAASDVVKDVAGFADAAIWKWTPGWGGTFVAFKGGTIQTEVVISGLPEDAALQSAKTLAAKPLGGSAKSGYAYAGAPGGPAVISAVTATPPAAPPANAAASTGANKTIRGTVSRVAVDFENPQHWMSIFFKEQPESSFVVCSPDPQMFRETIADLYTLVGKTMEVTGPVEKSQCSYAQQADSIRVLDSQHYRVLTPPAQPRRGVTADSAPRRAEPRVGLNIWNNDGKVDFDAFAQIRQAGVTGACMSFLAIASMFTRERARRRMSDLHSPIPVGSGARPTGSICSQVRWALELRQPDSGPKPINVFRSNTAPATFPCRCNCCSLPKSRGAERWVRTPLGSLALIHSKPST